jgi:hypothetical protein
MTEEELAEVIDLRVERKFDALSTKLRLDVTEKMFDLIAKAHTPDFELDQLGLLYCNGRKIFDMRQLLRDVLADLIPPKDDPDDGGDDGR